MNYWIYHGLEGSFRLKSLFGFDLNPMNDSIDCGLKGFFFFWLQDLFGFDLNSIDRGLKGFFEFDLKPMNDLIDRGLQGLFRLGGLLCLISI